MNTFYWSQNTLKAGTYDTYTKALYHFEDVTDATGNINGTLMASGTPANGSDTGGTATISTAQSKFGGSSLICNHGFFVSNSTSADYYVGGGNFTIDFWFQPGTNEFSYWRGLMMLSDTYASNNITTNANFAVLQMSPSKTFAFNEYINQTGSGSLPCNFTSPNSTSGSLLVGQWSHIALVRSGANWYLYHNGTRNTFTVGSGNLTTWAQKAGNYYLKIGSGGGGFNIAGNIDEFRLSKGIARWTSATFSVPTSQYNTI